MDGLQTDSNDTIDATGQKDQDADTTGSAVNLGSAATSSLEAENSECAGRDSPIFECPVCLQTASFPVQLPCKHIFCFLCVKGAAHRSKRCALCRQEIPADFFNEPKLLRADEVKEMSKTIFDEGYQWFYEGRNGWWQYDERTSVELESRYKKGEKDVFELLIAGFLYVIDLDNMRQYRRNDQHRRRKIRRDLRSISGIKGIAGLKYGDSPITRPSGDGGETSHGHANTNGNNPASVSTNQPNMLPPGDNNPVTGDDAYLTPSAPNNTPQTPMTPADSQPGSLSNSQEDLSVHLQNLHLDQNTSARQSSPDNLHRDYLAPSSRYSQESFLQNPYDTDDSQPDLYPSPPNEDELITNRNEADDEDMRQPDNMQPDQGDGDSSEENAHLCDEDV